MKIIMVLPNIIPARVLRNKRGRGPQRDRGRQAGFAERLNQAEGYINERLAARGETWQLDSATRKQLGLGLPPGSHHR